MTRSSSLALIAALVLLAGTAPAGQSQEQNQAPPQPTFRAGVELVRVDVSVTGPDDEAVTGLQPSDFEVEEDGIPQTVETMQFIQLDGTRTRDLSESLEIRSPEHAEAEAARDDVRVFAIFLDDYHVDWNPQHSSRAKRELKEWLTQLGPNDLVAIMDPITPLSSLQFTRSHEDLQARIDQFEGRRGRFLAPRNPAEVEQQGAPNRTETRGDVTLSALSSLVNYLGGLREGRKSVLLVSQGPATWPGSRNERTMRSVLQAANRGNVTIHAYDPQPLGFAGRGGREVLQRLYGETGGRAFFNANGTAERMRQVITDASAYYLVGYAPSRELADGEFHRITVRVKRNGVRVLARNSYWAPTAEEMNPPDPGPVEPGLEAALATLATPLAGRAAELWIGASSGPDAMTRLTVSWDLPESSDGPLPARLTVEPLDATSLESIGDLRSLVSAPTITADSPSTATFDMRQGTRFVLRFTAVGDDDEVVDQWTQPITVPGLVRDGLIVSTPRLFRARTPFEARAITSGTDRAPSATRRFSARDRVFVEVEGRRTGGEETVVTAQLLNSSGQALVDLPVPALVNGKARLSLPIASLAPSTYVLRLTTRAGDREVQDRIAFQVVR